MRWGGTHTRSLAVSKPLDSPQQGLGGRKGRGGGSLTAGEGARVYVQNLQRKGLSPPGAAGGAGGPLSGSKGCGKLGKLLGISGKVPAWGKALAEAGRAAAAVGTLLRGIGRDAL